MSYPACSSNACDCGRKACPTPEACQLPEPAPMVIALWPAVLVLIALVATALVVVWHR